MPRSAILHFALFLTACWSGLTCLPEAHAGQRKFAYAYEATTSPKGVVESENWVTWKSDGGNNGFEFRHEVEFGITDRLELGVYLANWSYDDAAGARYESSSVEAIYNLTNPTTDWLGSALYEEVSLGDEVFSLETKLLLQKNFGPLIVAYNLAIEAVWEGDDYAERAGELSQTLGVSFELTPRFSVGVEAFHEIPLPDWQEAGDSVVFAGPNLSFRAGRVFATAAFLKQLSDADGEPEWENRLIVGLEF